MRNGVPIICKTKFKGGNEKLPGQTICISHLFPLPVQSVPRTNLFMAVLMIITYGLGFASRLVSFCIGQNIYFGFRNSSRPRPTLLEGPGEATEYPYSHEVLFDVGMPICEAHIRALGSFIEQFSFWLDPIVHNVLKSLLNSGSIMEQGLCRVGILTQGIPGLPFSFANTSHVGYNDASSKNIGDIQNLIKNGKQQDNNQVQEGAKYIERWIGFTGSGLCDSTTCAYSFIGSFLYNVMVLQKFTITSYSMGLELHTV